MNSVEAVKAAAAKVGMPVTHIGPAVGRKPNYVSALAGKGSDPQVGTIVRLLKPCGYVLAAMPADAVPAEALVIDEK